MTDRALDLGSTARLVALVGEVATVDAAEPHPVGARVVLGAGAGMAASGKVVETARRPGGYRLRIRLFSPSAAVRAALAASLAGQPEGGFFPERRSAGAPRAPQDR